MGEQILKKKAQLCARIKTKTVVKIWVLERDELTLIFLGYIFFIFNSIALH